MSLPNVRFLQNLFELLVLKDWRYREWGILDDTHLRFFTFKSARRLLLANGFEIEEFRGSPIKRWFMRVLVAPFGWILGNDVKYLQMLIRARLK